MSKIGFAPVSKILSHLCLSLGIIGCAEIGPPPGGEVDKVKPRILSSIPFNGATSVEKNNEIVVQFSERIQKPTSANSIYISPRLQSNPKIKWKSDKVIITLPDSFKVNQTYIISFAEGLVDLRKNPLDSGSIIAFSTGTELANGSINGFVIDEENTPQPQTVVALYDQKQFDSMRIDSLYPLYMGVSSTDGYFSFLYIPDGVYQVIAFTDINKNDLFDADNEFYGLPEEKLVLDSLNRSLKNVNLTLTNYIEKEIDISSAYFSDNNLLKIQFNQNILQLPKIEFENYKFTLHTYTDTTIKHFSQFNILPDSSNPNSLNAYFGKLPVGRYQLNLLSQKDSIVFDSIDVKEKTDKTIPTILKFSPDPLSQIKDSIKMFIQFSEPVDTSIISNETFYFVDSDSNVIFPDFEIKNQSFIQFSNSYFRDELGSYTLHISEFDILDLSGNKMGDSTMKKFINLLHPDSLGFARGSILQNTESNYSTTIEFKNLFTGQLFSMIANSNNFNMLLPQGKYFLSGFIDLNNNNKRDLGKLSPLIYAEPYTLHPDTINVRARFESTDIKLEFK